MDNNLEKEIRIGCVQSHFTESINKKLFGEVMTIVDASILDNSSKKAVKSLISQAFSRNTNVFFVELSKIDIEGGK